MVDRFINNTSQHRMPVWIYLIINGAADSQEVASERTTTGNQNNEILHKSGGVVIEALYGGIEITAKRLFINGAWMLCD